MSGSNLLTLFPTKAFGILSSIYNLQSHTSMKQWLTVVENMLAETWT